VQRITRYDSLLRNAAAASALKPDWVIRFGGTPVSKTLAGWLAGVPALLVEPSGRWSDPTHDLRGRIECDAVSFRDLLREAGWHESAPVPHRTTWTARWATLEARIDRLAESYLAEAPWCEAQLITHTLRRLPAGDAVFCANSLPIRQIDTWSGQGTTRLHLFGQRGASGIDGTSSVLAGLNAGRAEQSQGVTGLLGDLSFRHDLSGLTLLERLDRPCIVLNNGGGRIFDYLPQRGLPDYERLWQTPSRLEVGALARAFGLPHRLVETGPGFEQALDESLGAGLRGESAGLIEVRIDAGLSLDMHQVFWQRIRADSIIDD
jgi:2-succinyl-5-enolpyruvyl-6-hydroxy-3-cyclohexene-1-carboxylate synthase